MSASVFSRIRTDSILKGSVIPNLPCDSTIQSYNALGEIEVSKYYDVNGFPDKYFVNFLILLSR